MPSAIDATIPPFGNALTSGERANWATAKSEISALQAGKADLASPNFTGNPTAPTAAPGDNDTSIATTAFVAAAVVASTSGVANFNGRTGAVTLTTADVTNAGGVAAASGAFTGNPTAPTQATADSSTRIATTALVAAKIAAAAVPAPATTTPQMDGAGAAGTALTYARGDHRHPTDTSRAPVASPVFTGNAEVGGNLLVDGGSLSISSANAYEWSIYREASSGDHIQIHRAGWYDRWESATGYRRWVCAGSVGMTLDASGNLTPLGNITAGGNAISLGPGGLMQISIVGTQRALQFATSWGWAWDATNGNLIYNTTSGGFWNMRISDWFAFNNFGPVGGLGAYVNLCDVRGKAEITEAAPGLAELLRLSVVGFRRKRIGGLGPKEFGFTAQQVRDVIPEAVVVADFGVPEASVDDPALGVAHDAILAVAVNAIKQLEAIVRAQGERIAALEARAPA